MAFAEEPNSGCTGLGILSAVGMSALSIKYLHMCVCVCVCVYLNFCLKNEKAGTLPPNIHNTGLVLQTSRLVYVLRSIFHYHEF